MLLIWKQNLKTCLKFVVVSIEYDLNMNVDVHDAL